MKSTTDAGLKLMGLWITLMFLYVYCDIYSFHRTGYMNEMIAGMIGPFVVSQGLLAAFGLMMIVPALMIPACLFLKPGASRRLNIVVGIIYTIINACNLVGETWVYYWMYGIVEIVLTICIVVVSIRWAKGEASNA